MLTMVAPDRLESCVPLLVVGFVFPGLDMMLLLGRLGALLAQLELFSSSLVCKLGHCARLFFFFYRAYDNSLGVLGTVEPRAVGTERRRRFVGLNLGYGRSVRPTRCELTAVEPKLVGPTLEQLGRPLAEALGGVGSYLGS